MAALRQRVSCVERRSRRARELIVRAAVPKLLATMPIVVPPVIGRMLRLPRLALLTLNNEPSVTFAVLRTKALPHGFVVCHFVAAR
jgi:hypothetical protein